MEIIDEIINDDLSPMGQMRFWTTENSSLIDDSKLAKEKFEK